MKNLKKVVAIVLTAAIAFSMGIAGTVAYLTQDVGKKTNTFQVGELKVYLSETTDVITSGNSVKGDKIVEDEEGAEYSLLVPGDKIVKKVTVSNDENAIDAYVKVTVTLKNDKGTFANLLNKAIDDAYEVKDADGNVTNADEVQKIYNEVFDGWGINYNPRPGATGKDDARGVIDGTYGLPEHVLKVDFSKTTNFDNDTTMFGVDNWFKSEAEEKGGYSAWLSGGGYYTSNLVDNEETTEVDERDYNIIYTYYIDLPAGASTTLFNGFNIPLEFTTEQLAMFDGLEIDIKADAVQKDNFVNAKSAFMSLATGGESKVEPWIPEGTITPAYTSANSIWGETTSEATESVVIKFFSGETYMGETSLNDIDNIIDGDVYVTWNIKLNPTNDADSYWTMKWEKAPSLSLMPTKAELWIDGVKTGENKVQLNGPDNLKPIGGAVVNEDGTILRYVVKGTEPNVQAGETYVPFITDDSNLDEAITNGATTLVLGSGNYIIPDSAQGKNLTIIGNGDTVIATQDDGSYEGCDYSLDGSTVTFENITINTDSSTYTGYARMKGTYKNCTINGTYTLYDDSVFENCTFNVTGDVYNIWTWGAPNATFINCTFNSDGKAILLYGGTNTKLTVNGCTFNDKGGLTDLKAAIEVGTDWSTNSYELIVKNTTVNGYEINDKGISTGTTLWANKNSMTQDRLNVVVDGVDVY